MVSRCLLVLAVLAGLLIAPASSFTDGPFTQPAAAAPAPAGSQGAALEQVGACIAAGGRGDVLLVLDTSGSLNTSDPNAVRVAAARYLLNELTAFTQSSGASIDVAVAGFDTGYHPAAGGWRSLDDGGADAISADLDRYQGRQSGQDTDYWAAVDGARKSLLAKADQTPQASSCPVWFWFSDGAYDVVPRAAGKLAALGGAKPYAPGNDLATKAKADQARAAGEQDLCRPGGQADQTRVAGITTVAVGLVHQGADFALLQRVSSGEGAACGDQPPRGAFYPADQLDGIFFAFDQFSTPGQPPLSHTGQVCGRSPCAEGTHSFVTDASLGSVRLLAGSDVTGQQITLTAPGQPPLTLPATDGETSTPGATIRWRWVSTQTVQVIATRTGDPGWSGQWQVVFLDPAGGGPHGTSRTSVHLYGDLAPAWAEPSATLTKGGSQSLALQLKRPSNGEVVDPASLPSTLDASLTLVSADGTATTLASGLTKATLTQPVDADLSDVALGQAQLRLDLRITTAAADVAGQRVPGTALEPQSVSYPVQIVAPPQYPTVPGSLRFPALEGVEPVTATLPISGDGCVWLAETPPATALPAGVTATLSAPAKDQASCVSGELPITITPSAAGNGLVAGTLQVMAAPGSGDGEPVALPVAYTLEMAKPADQPLRLAVFVAVLLLGVGVPLLALYLVKWWSATLPATTVFVRAARGQVAADRSFLDAEPVPGLNQFDAVSLSGSPRAATLQTRAAAPLPVRVVTGLAPTEPGYVRVDAGGWVVTSVGAGAKLPVDLRNQWVAALDPADPLAGPVTVWLIVSDQARIDTVLADARRRLPRAVADLRAALPPGPAAPASGDGWEPVPAQAATSDGWTPSTPAQQTPANQSPANQSPAKQSPAKQSPVSRLPGKQSPVRRPPAAPQQPPDRGTSDDGW